MKNREEKRRRPKTKRVMATYQLNQLNEMSQYLTDMAAKGWILKDINMIYYVFEQGEPCNRRYIADVFEKASSYSVAPSQAQQEYAEYCRNAGWDYVTSNGKIVIFATDDPEAVEIQNDKEIELERIHKAMIRGTVLPCLFVFALYVLLAYMDMKSTVAEGYPWMISGVCLFFLYLPLEYLIWYVRSKKSLREYGIYAPSNHKRVTIVQWTLLAVLLIGLAIYLIQMDIGMGLVMFVFALVEIVVIWGVFVLARHLCNKLKTPGWVNAIIMFIMVFIAIMIVTAMMSFGMIGGVLLSDSMHHKTIDYTYIDESGEEATIDQYCDTIPVDLELMGVEIPEGWTMSTYADAKPYEIDHMMVMDFYQRKVEDDYSPRNHSPYIDYSLFTTYDDIQNVMNYCWGTEGNKTCERADFDVSVYGIDALYMNPSDTSYRYLAVNDGRALYIDTGMELNNDQFLILIKSVLNSDDYQF